MQCICRYTTCKQTGPAIPFSRSWHRITKSEFWTRNRRQPVCTLPRYPFSLLQAWPSLTGRDGFLMAAANLSSRSVCHLPATFMIHHVIPPSRCSGTRPRRCLLASPVGLPRCVKHNPIRACSFIAMSGSVTTANPTISKKKIEKRTVPDPAQI